MNPPQVSRMSLSTKSVMTIFCALRKRLPTKFAIFYGVVAIRYSSLALPSDGYT